MKKYSVFRLYVINIKGTKFICEPIVPGNMYKEVLTGRKINYNEDYSIERFSEYYSMLERMNYTTHEPLRVTKSEILSKYLSINAPLEEEAFEETSDLATLISQSVKDEDGFYRQIGESIIPEEREYIKSKLATNCDTCTNENCIVAQSDKPTEDCFGWQNDAMLGKYMVLQLNRRKTNNNEKQTN